MEPSNNEVSYNRDWALKQRNWIASIATLNHTQAFWAIQDAIQKAKRVEPLIELTIEGWWRHITVSQMPFWGCSWMLPGLVIQHGWEITCFFCYGWDMFILNHPFRNSWYTKYLWWWLRDDLWHCYPHVTVINNWIFGWGTSSNYVGIPQGVVSSRRTTTIFLDVAPLFLVQQP